MSFRVVIITADTVVVEGPADADDPKNPWLLHVPIVEGELVRNLMCSRGGPMRCITPAERREVLAVCAEALREHA